MMSIQICPVKRLYQILTQIPTEDTGAILSSASEIKAEKLRGIPYVFRQYEDLDYECPGRSFSWEDAMAFAAFVKSPNRPEKLFCCCDAGESRSPAVAAAVMRYLELDDLPIWNDPRYHPNMLVFSMLAEALDVPVTDEEMDLRMYINQKAFRDALQR